MFTFFTKKILNNLRNRSYFETLIEDGTIKSEGAWRITIVNNGNADVILTDGSGAEFSIMAPAGQTAPLSTTLILDGEPYAVRDDEIDVVFDNGNDPKLSIIFDRMVSKKETNDYPQDRLMEQG